jgi:hypothetical protein
MRKKILMPLAIVSFIVCSSFKSSEPSVMTDKDKQNSTFFKMSRNSNRMQIFEQLAPILKAKTNNSGYASLNNNRLSTYADVVLIFGEPDIKLKFNQFVYTLNAARGCKVIFEFDVNKELNYFVVKDCN